MVVCEAMGKKAEQAIVSVGFVALGCPKNIVDSEKMLARIGEAGFVLSGDVNSADIVVINTCGFIKPAKDEAFEAIREAARQKKKGKVKKVIVAGCLVQRMGEALTKEVEGIDAIVALGRRDDIGRIIKEAITPGSRQPCGFYLEGLDRQIQDDRGRLLITARHRVYLRISEGCDRGCSFCTIPAIKGRFRSKPAELVLAEAQELVRNGAVEISIIAQDSTYYGRDLGIKNGLSRLVKELEKIEALRWIRLMYLYPAGIDDGLIETIAGSEKAVNYIDMPVQHINDNVLKAMRRGDRKEKIAELIEKLRRAMPDVALRTTIIAGFPGESDEQFEELLDFVRWAKFDALGCFGFYAEEGTAAAQMPGQVSEVVKRERVDRLMLAQQEIAFSKGPERMGRELVCLVDEPDGSGLGRGRFYGQAPEIDSICYIEKCSANAGEFISVKVVGTRDYDLVVRPIL
jgi:ribosomal protein S12 methylthiotransferase